jgi:heme-binding protein
MIIVIASISILILSFTIPDVENTNSTNDNNSSTYKVPENVQAIIDNSCYGCHNTDSKSKKGKMKLNFDNMEEYKLSKQIGKLMKISKTVKNGKMPKKQFIEKYPEKKLSEVETDILTSWADNMATDLSGE